MSSLQTNGLLMAHRPGATDPRRGSAGRPRTGVLVAAVLLSILGLRFTALPARAQVPESWTITIDASTTQPVGTGLVPAATGGSVYIFAEGALRGPSLPARYEDGWFGPGGLNHYDDAAQPIVDGMPYGSLVGGFNTSIPSYQYLGRMGSFSTQPSHVGQEFRLALNIPGTDLATLEGQITVTVVYVPPAGEESGKYIIRHDTPLPLATGLIAGAGDRFIVMARGALQDPALPNSAYTDGDFGPEGLLGLEVALQPHADGPYGALYGKIGLSSEFYIGGGGTWSTQPSDEGNELELNINTDAVSQAGLIGKFVVYAFRVPPPDPAEVSPADASGAIRTVAAPNPMTSQTTIRFGLESEGRARLRVFDARGRRVRSLADGVLGAGVHSVDWDGRDEAGSRVPAGTYFYQFSTRDESKNGRIVILK